MIVGTNRTGLQFPLLSWEFKGTPPNACQEVAASLSRGVLRDNDGEQKPYPIPLILVTNHPDRSQLTVDGYRHIYSPIFLIFPRILVTYPLTNCSFGLVQHLDFP